MKTVYVGIPSSDGKPYPEVIINILRQELPEGYKLIFDLDNIVVGQVVHRARNDIVRKFLDGGYDYLLFCDDDNPPSIDALKFMLEDSEHAVSGLVPLRHGNGDALNVSINGDCITSIIDLPDLFEIDNFGTGFCLLDKQIVKDVFRETNGYPYMFGIVDFVYNLKTERKELYERQDTLRGRKDTYIHKDGIITKMQGEIGEDLNFGVVARRLGYKFYADKRCKCRHYKGIPEALFVKNQ